MVGHLGHNVGRIFMLVFGVGTRARRGRRRDRRARAGDAVEHGGAARADPVRGRRGRRPRLAAGRVRCLAADRPGADLRGLDERLAGRRVRSARVRDYAQTWLSDIWNVTIAQIAPIMPYVLLVLILIFRPMGLMGTRET